VGGLAVGRDLFPLDLLELDGVVDAVKHAELLGVVLWQFGAIELEDRLETLVLVVDLQVIGERVVGVEEG